MNKTIRFEGVTYRPIAGADLPDVARLHAAVLGPGRFSRTAYRIREAAPMISPFCRLAEEAGRLIAAVSFTEICIGARPRALLLGPLVVSTEHANRGIGRRLTAEGLSSAAQNGIELTVLVGDLAYYGRMGFGPVPPGQILFPGPVDPNRILARETSDGNLARFTGLISASM